VLRFLTTVRDSGKQRPRLAALFGSLELDRNDRTVQLRWPLPQEAIAALLARRRSAPAPPSTAPPSATSPTDAPPQPSAPAEP
jgi:hypothetical protein